MDGDQGLDQITNTPLLRDTKVDDLAGERGKIDEVPRLEITGIKDEEFIPKMNKRIKDSDNYWNTKDGGFNLEAKRNINEQYFYGDQLKGLNFQPSQTKYQENQLYIATDSVRSFLSAKNVVPSVMPASTSPLDKYVATNLEKGLDGLAHKVDLSEKLGQVILNNLLKHVGVLKLEFDPTASKQGEIRAEVIDPKNITVDKNAKQGENPAFIASRFSMSLDEIMHRWGKKNKGLKDRLTVKANRTEDDIYEVTEVWFTSYNDKYDPEEMFAFYTKDCLLDYGRNPNYIYTAPEKNFINEPMKPFIPMNLTGDGQHWIDRYEPIEQAIPIQDVLNKRGRQLIELVDRANPLTLYDKNGLTDNDVDNIGANPVTAMGIEVQNGKSVNESIVRLPAAPIPPVIMQDKTDLRTQIHAIYGTPSEFTGASSGNEVVDQTLGQSEMKRQQAEGRLNQYQRAVDVFLTKVMNYMVQLIAVYYTDLRAVTYTNHNGSYESVVIGRDNINKNVEVQVEEGSTTTMNDSRREALVQMFLDKGLLAPTDAFEMMDMPNSQKVYDNLQKFRENPNDLVREDGDDDNEVRAYIIFQNIAAGNEEKPNGDESEELLLAMRKFMSTDDYLKSKSNVKKQYSAFVDESVQNIGAKQLIDKAYAEGGLMSLNTKVKIPANMAMDNMKNGLFPSTVGGDTQDQQQAPQNQPQQAPAPQEQSMPQGQPAPQQQAPQQVSQQQQ